MQITLQWQTAFLNTKRQMKITRNTQTGKLTME